MTAMSPFIRALITGGLITVPAAMVGEALGFGPWAWFVFLLVMMFVTSLFDREGFYGPREPR